MNFLVNHVKNTLQGFLVQTLYKVLVLCRPQITYFQPDDLDQLLSESGSIAQHRKEYQLQLQACENAQKTLAMVRDDSTIQW